MTSEQRGPGQLTGTVGPFEIAAPLGVGAMGWVYRAVDTRSGESVAVKIMHPHLSADPAFRARFERAADAGSRFQGPHVVRQRDAGDADGYLYVAMELVEGPSLRAVLRSGPLPPSRVAAFAAQLAEALIEAEAAGVVHRDIKPENLLIGPDDTLKVADFGIARIEDLEGLTPTETALGSAAYMAPERASGQTDARSDVYSAGVVLYECLTGQTPFAGSVLAQLDQHRSAPVPVGPLSGAPAGLRSVVLRCLQKRPEERFQSAVELREALQGITTRRPSQRTSRVLVGAAAIVLGVVTALGTIGAIDDKGPSQPARSSPLGDIPTATPGPAPAPPRLTSPTPGDVLPAGPIEVSWTKGVGPTKFDLQASFNPNQAFFDMDDGPRTSTTVPEIPKGGPIVLLRLVGANTSDTISYTQYYLFGAPGGRRVDGEVTELRVGPYGETDTGIDVPEGSYLSVFASGGMFINSATDRVNPDGDPTCGGASPDPKGFLAPRLPCYALVGRIGAGPHFLVGTEGVLESAPAGRLFLSMNDDNFTDNRGNWRAIVTVAQFR